MAFILSWLAVYTFILLGVSRAAEAWRERSWFKLAFLPGTLLAAGTQMAAGLLCVPSSRVNLLGDRKPAFAFEEKKVPWLAGALFVLVAHTLLYIIYLVAAVNLESAGLFSFHLLSLPGVRPGEILEGRIYVDLQGYLWGLRETLALAARRPFIAAGILYVAAGTFASMRVTRRECLWALVLFLLAALATWICGWFELGFPFLSRGWWAGYSHFPSWWALFSTFITLALGSLALFAIPGTVEAVRRALKKPQPEGKKSTRRLTVEV